MIKSITSSAVSFFLYRLFAILCFAHAKDSATLIDDKNKIADPLSLSSETSHELLKIAFESKRLDLIKEGLRLNLWDAAGIGPAAALWAPIDELPNSLFKDSVTLLMLRSDSHDSSEIEFSLKNNRMYPLLSSGPYWSIILKYFPDIPLRDALVYNVEARKMTADALEHVIAHPEEREELQTALQKAVETAPGKNMTAPAPRSTAFLRSALQELDSRLMDQGKLKNTDIDNQYENLELLKSKTHLTDEFKAAEWIEAHAKSTESGSKKWRPASTIDPATLPVHTVSREGSEDNAQFSRAWLLWAVLASTGFFFSAVLWWVQRRKSFRGHEI